MLFPSTTKRTQYFWGTIVSLLLLLSSGAAMAAPPEDNPVEALYTKLVASDPSFRAHHAAFGKSWGAYIALFTPESKAVIQQTQRAWLKRREGELSGLVGTEASFKKKVLQQDTARMEHFALVVSLAQKPDARLLYVLRPLHALLPGVTSEGNGANVVDVALNELEERTAAVQKKKLVPAEDDARQVETQKGLAGGPTVSIESITGTGRNAIQDMEEHTFNPMPSTNASGWGLSTLHSTNVREELLADTAFITHIANGKISFLTPPLPAGEKFFSSGNVEWPYPELKEGEQYAKCTMEPVLRISLSPSPSITALYEQTFEQEYAPSFLCTAECTIPYTWNGSSFTPGKADCLPKVQWGVSKSEAE